MIELKQHSVLASVQEEMQSLLHPGVHHWLRFGHACAAAAEHVLLVLRLLVKLLAAARLRVYHQKLLAGLHSNQDEVLQAQLQDPQLCRSQVSLQLVILVPGVAAHLHLSCLVLL